VREPELGKLEPLGDQPVADDVVAERKSQPFKDADRF
jgi:hypothetical protein